MTRFTDSFSPIIAGFIFFFVIIGGEHLTAQTVDTVGPRPLADSSTIEEVRSLVDRFMKVAHLPKGLDSTTITSLSADWLEGYLLERAGEPFFQVANRYVVGDVRTIRPEKSILMVEMVTYPDSVPGHGLVEVDWNWFLRETEQGWRISAVRRTQGLFRAMQTLQLIDSAAAYPPSVKPLLAREEGAILMSNAQLRDLFEANRAGLKELVVRLAANSGIRVLERAGDHPRQVNTKMVDWGMAAHTLTDQMIEEFYQTAPEEMHGEIEARLRAAESQRKKASDAMAEILREIGVRTSAVDEIILLMKQSRVRFVNTETPFKDGVILTVAGAQEQAIGFLYSPHGELPWINPEEFFHLEKLSDEWWIFRSA